MQIIFNPYLQYEESVIDLIVAEYNLLHPTLAIDSV